MKEEPLTRAHPFHRARWAGCGLLAAVWLLGFACMIISSPPALAGLQIEQTPGDAPLTLNVTADELTRVNVTITHEAPNGGPVVDRVVPLEVDASETASVELHDIRVGQNVSIEAFPASAPIPTIPGTKLPNASALEAMEPLATANASSLVPGPDSDKGRVVFHKVASNNETTVGAKDALQLQTTPRGFVSVGFWHSSGDIVVRSSEDGGQSFPHEVNVTDGEERSQFWSSAEAPGDRLVVITREDHVGWTWTRLHPVDGVEAKQPLGGSSDAEFDIHDAHLVTPSGPDTILSTQGTAEQGNESYPEGEGDLMVWRIEPDGEVEHVTDLDPVGDYDRSAPRPDHRSAAQGAKVALMGSTRDGNETFPGIWLSTSMDSGHTFSPAASIDAGLPEGLNWTVFDVAISSTGTVHALAMGSKPYLGPERIEAHYIRIPEAGPSTSFNVTERLPDTATDQHGTTASRITAGDGYVWLLMNDDDGVGMRFLESGDDGHSFSDPFRLLGAGTAWGMPAEDTLPGGRPVYISLERGGIGDVNVVPLYDPIPPEDSGLVEIHKSTQARPSPSPNETDRAPSDNTSDTSDEDPVTPEENATPTPSSPKGNGTSSNETGQTNESERDRERSMPWMRGPVSALVVFLTGLAVGRLGKKRS